MDEICQNLERKQGQRFKEDKGGLNSPLDFSFNELLEACFDLKGLLLCFKPPDLWRWDSMRQGLNEEKKKLEVKFYSACCDCQTNCLGMEKDEGRKDEGRKEVGERRNRIWRICGSRDIEWYVYKCVRVQMYMRKELKTHLRPGGRDDSFDIDE